MAEPKDMIVPMLKEIRAEMNSGFENVKKRFDGVDKRLEKIEDRQKNFDALIADTMMSKFVTGDFERGIGALEKKVDELMKRS